MARPMRRRHGIDPLDHAPCRHRDGIRLSGPSSQMNREADNITRGSRVCAVV